MATSEVAVTLPRLASQRNAAVPRVYARSEDGFRFEPTVPLTAKFEAVVFPKDTDPFAVRSSVCNPPKA